MSTSLFHYILMRRVQRVCAQDWPSCKAEVCFASGGDCGGADASFLAVVELAKLCGRKGGLSCVVMP